METKRKNKKNTSVITEDLKLNRGLNVKLKTLDINNPKVIEITFNLFAIPKEQCDVDDYEESITNIEKKYKLACKEYINSNKDIFQDRFISDFNFTSANLKKDYNKYVTMSLYARQKKELNFKKLKSIIKNTLKETTFKISKEIIANGFTCSKNKK